MLESKDPEIALLGMGLHHINEFDALVTELGLKREHFEKPNHQIAWDILQTFIKQKEQPEAESFLAEFETKGSGSGFLFVADLSMGAALAGTGQWYARAVKRNAAIRYSRSIITELAKHAQEDDPEAAYRMMVAFTQEFGAQIASPGSIGLDQHVAGWLERLESLQTNGQKIRSPLAGFERLDIQIGGLIPGEMLLVCGATSSGKSSLIRAIAFKLAKADIKVAIVSLEDPVDAWINRAVSDEAEIDLRAIRSGLLDGLSYRKAVTNAVQLANLPMYIQHIAPATIEAILIGIRRLRPMHPRYVCVDYLQSIHDGDRRGRHVELSQSLARIKAACGDIGASLIMASQINREAYKESREIPPLWAAKETGDAENQAEAVAILWCSRMNEHEGVGHEQDCMSLHVLKSKHGTCGRIPLKWTGWRTKYEEIGLVNG